MMSDMLDQLPDFIDKGVLDLELSAGKLDKEFRIGDMSVKTYLTKRKASGRPLPSKTVEIKSGKGFMYTYLVKDVIESALLDGYQLMGATARMSKSLTVELTREQRWLESEIGRLSAQRSALMAENKLAVGDLTDISPSIHYDGFNLVPQSEIVAKAKSYGDACGVYFLVNGDEIVYIGQSVNIAGRLSGHRDKVFDSVAFVTCKKSELDILESLYIIAYRPKLNGYAGGNGSKRLATPMTLRQITNACQNMAKGDRHDS